MSKAILTAQLEHVATKFDKQIFMSGAYYRPDVFDRMYIKTISGLQFKHIKHLLNRKAHTTKKKQVGTAINSEFGFLEPRELETKLTWNRYKDNKDNYIQYELADVDGGIQTSYPFQEEAFFAATASYGEDIFDCLFHGDKSIAETDDDAYLNLYDGFITDLNQDIAKGRISTHRKNFVKLNAIAKPTTTSDFTAFKEFEKFRSAWSTHLKNAPKVVVYCSDETGAAIASAYEYSHGHHKFVIQLENGNYKFPEWRNIEVCAESCFGIGDKLIATVPYNFEYGVDTESRQSQVHVQVGSDDDANDIIWQIQSLQGTRVFNVNPSNFCMSDGSLVPYAGAGDYTKNTFAVVANDSTMGSVTVNGATLTAPAAYAAGTTLTLVATAASNAYEFVKWSNEETTATISIVTKGIPGGIIAIFKEK